MNLIVEKKMMGRIMQGIHNLEGAVDMGKDYEKLINWEYIRSREEAQE